MTTENGPNGNAVIAAGSTADPPRAWWQWFLIYPTFAIAMVGAVPTYVELGRSLIGVRSPDAVEQNRLWQENLACTKKAKFLRTINKKKVEIASIVCESGDVLLFGKRPDWEQPKYRWVAWSQVAPPDKQVGLLQLIPSANASEDRTIKVAQVPKKVLCQRWVGEGRLLQRISTPQGKCFDQVINTYTGWVISSRTVPCNPSC